MAKCYQPFVVKKDTPDEQQVPCGKCPACRARTISGWSFRLMQEAKVSISAHWITLTYAPEHIHNNEKGCTRITDNGFMTLCAKDLELFFKRLRHLHEDFPTGVAIKYFAVGEYGGRFNRPHYHVSLFNARPELIQKAWHHGQVHYGEVTEASVGYTMKYMSKPGKIPMHRNDDRVPEFRRMSKGLGKSYLTPAMCKWHKADPNERMYCNLEDGKKIGMPRYYKTKIYTDAERQEIGEHLAKQMFRDFVQLVEKKGYANVKWSHTQKFISETKRMHSNALKGRDKLL